MLLPEEKAQKFINRKEVRKSSLVGDGINDALLSVAVDGIAMELNRYRYRKPQRFSVDNQ